MNDNWSKKSVLFAARARFAPELQPIKEAAIDKLVEQNLLFADSDQGMSLTQIEKSRALCFPDGSTIVNRTDLEEALARLKKQKRLQSSVREGATLYKLSKQAQKEVLTEEKFAEDRFDRVLKILFSEKVNNPLKYKDAFLYCLCLIFSRLGAIYVDLLRQEITSQELVKSPSVLTAFQETRDVFEEAKDSAFREGLFDFFENSEPDYDAIKWNMGQNYYVAHALGLYGGSHLLSKDVFGDGMFYLDTNILLHALEPLARLHGSFNVFATACEKLGTGLKLCRVTVEELERVIDYNRQLLPKVVDQIPPPTTKKVKGIFYQLYLREKKSHEEVNFDNVFSGFSQPVDDLNGLYGVELVDDLWFDRAKSESETNKLAKRISSESQDKRNRTKGTLAALHDALLIRWVKREREVNDNKVWILTLDRSLPSATSSDQDRAFAITLDAVLQWISPIAIGEDSEDKVARIFSEAVKYQLLPYQSFFTLQDFLIFAEMEWSCKDLPADDVERCMQSLRVNMPDHDPTDPRDREKLSLAVRKFFSDPSRAYAKEMDRMKAEVDAERDQRSEKERQIKELQSQTQKLEAEIEHRDKRDEQLKLKRSAHKRLLVVTITFILLEVGAFYLAGEYGEGDNLAKKIADLWLYPSSALGLSIVVGLFIIGRERIRVLGWPLKKLFKESDD